MLRLLPDAARPHACAHGGAPHRAVAGAGGELELVLRGRSVPVSDTPAANRRQVAQAETPDTIGAFPRLSDEQVAVLLVRGQRRTLTDGEVLIRPGEHPSSL